MDVGDFQATLFDHNSKNLTYGKTIIEKGRLSGAGFEGLNINSVEGIMTAKALIKKQQEFNNRTAENKQIKLPIVQAVDDICSGRVPLKDAPLYLSNKITEAINLE